MNINEVTLAGRLTRDPEIRYSPKGTAICRTGIAVNRSWSGEDGQKKEEVTFVDVDFLGDKAEHVAKFFTKGRPIYIRGRLRLEQWTDKQTNQPRTKLSVTGEQFQFVDSKPDSSGAVSPERAREELQKLKAATAPSAEPENQDIPF